MQSIILLISAILGSSVISVLVNGWLNRNKLKSDVHVQESSLSFEQGKDIELRRNVEIEGLKKELREQGERVDILNTNILKIQSWIIKDTANYVCWLERKVREHEPDIDFPKREPFPFDL